MKHKTLSFLLAVLMSMVTSVVLAYDAEIDGIYYNFFGTSATVTYANSYGKYSGSVEIPETVTFNGKDYNVTEIGELAFYKCSGLTSITIPNSIMCIGRAALDYTAWYNSQPDGVVYAGKVAYKYKGTMPENTEIVLKEGTLGIADHAFDNCRALTSVTIPNGVTSIGSSAFAYCTGLTSITIPNSVTSIGSGAFGNTAWYDNQLDGVVYAGKVAYTYKGTMPENTEIVLEDGTLGIAERAFASKSSLSSVIIPNSVACIGSEGFYNSGALKNVIIGDNVKEIKYGTFQHCKNLTTVTIPEGVTSIGSYAFYECSNLTSVSIPKTVKCIDGYAFSGCSVLTSINIPNGVTSIDSYTFSECSNLSSVSLPNSITSIGERAFYKCSSLNEITIPDGVTSIGLTAFCACSGLASITIPNSVTSIGKQAFQETAWYDNQPDGVVYAGKVAYKYKGTMPENAEIKLEEGTLGIASGAFYEFGAHRLVSISIPNSVICIGNDAFSYCSALTSITIPNSVTSIEPNTFAYCSGLTDVSIPESVTSIGGYAFCDCRGLSTVTIPNSVTLIGDGAFEYCSSLTDVYSFATDVPSTGGSVFFTVDLSSATLHVPSSALVEYAATSPWSEFGTIEAIPVNLQDGEVYTNDVNSEESIITYTRMFNNTNWQALYVPFEMSYDDWKGDFEVARINNMNQYDDDEDGTVDRTVMEVFYIRSGRTEANTPYVIRAKETGEKTLTVTNAMLYAAEENSFSVSSWTTLFTFTGTYSGVPGTDMVFNGYYGMGGGRLQQAASEANSLSPYRWYMAVTDRDGNPKNLGEVKVMVFGMEDETDNLTPTLSHGEGGSIMYDLSGRRVAQLRKGLYIRSGKKVVIK